MRCVVCGMWYVREPGSVKLSVNQFRKLTYMFILSWKFIFNWSVSS
jgi:hypothetical protein